MGDVGHRESQAFPQLEVEGADLGCSFSRSKESSDHQMHTKRSVGEVGQSWDE